MKKYIVGFFGVVLAAVVTGVLFAQYMVKECQNSAAWCGYNFAVENSLEQDMKSVTIRYEQDKNTLEAVSPGIVSAGEKRYFRLNADGILNYKVIVKIPDKEEVEAELQDDFGRDQIVRYEICEEGGKIVLKK